MTRRNISEELALRLHKKLSRGIEVLELSISEEKITLLMAYLHLFHKWNLTYNLSSIRNPEEMVHRHLLDSLSVVKYIHGERFIDVGTGGGLPGIPLAILFPEKKFTLLDSNGKKTRFLFHVKTSLNLHNVSIENSRVEAFQPEEKFDGVISRAFASIKDMVDGCHHLLAKDGLFWAMKGQYPEDELSALEKHYKVVDCFPLNVPDSEGERHLLAIKNTDAADLPQ